MNKTENKTPGFWTLSVDEALRQTTGNVGGLTTEEANRRIILPNLPFASILGFTPVPFTFYIAMLSIVTLYILSAELTKKWFYKYVK